MQNVKPVGAGQMGRTNRITSRGWSVDGAVPNQVKHLPEQTADSELVSLAKKLLAGK